MCVFRYVHLCACVFRRACARSVHGVSVCVYACVVGSMLRVRVYLCLRVCVRVKEQRQKQTKNKETKK